MLSNEDNELMCRVGAETPMGKAMRQFWVPAMLSSELPKPGGDPVHVELLGQDLVAFRDLDGKVGILDELCRHRATSLAIGRVESGGLRCIYHGWLFSVDGTVLETPNVADPNFKDRVKARAYPVREAGGLVWTYLGPQGETPAFPDFPWIDSPENMRFTACQINACNYVQLLEGLLDSSHLTVLHGSVLKKVEGSELDFAKKTSHMKFDAAPQMDAEATEFGLQCSAVRLLDGKAETRVTAFISPFWILNPNGDIVVAVVPMTDERSAFYTVWWDGVKRYGEEPLKSEQKRMIGFNDEMLAAFGQTRDTCDGPQAMTRANRWRQDREMIRQGHATGVPTLALEDSLVSVSGGAIRPRDKEMLSSADIGIALLFRLLLKSARQAQAGGKAVGAGVSLREVRGVSDSLPVGTDWRTLVPQHRTVQVSGRPKAEEPVRA